MNFTFNSIHKTNKYYSVIHNIEKLPFLVELNKHSMLLYSEKCLISDTLVNPQILSYKITQRIYVEEISIKTICTDSWHNIEEASILKEIDIGTKYNQEICVFTCLEKVINETSKCKTLCPFECKFSIFIINDSSYCDSTRNITENEAVIRVSYKNLHRLNTKEIPKMEFNELISSIGCVFLENIDVFILN